jgi:hypothetical protein
MANRLKDAFDRVSETARKVATYADAHIATVGAASLDASLEGALLTKMRPLSNTMKDRLFDGAYTTLTEAPGRATNTIY